MAAWILAVQLALGGLLLSLSADDSARALRRGALTAAAVAAIVELLGRWIDGSSATLEVVAGASTEGRWLFLLGGLLATPGAFLVLVAGRAEHAGVIERARRVVRRGGFLVAGGALVAVVANIATLSLTGFSTAEAFPLWASLITAAAGGFAGLLAGLAGKPRPTGYLSAALLVTSVVTWLTAL
jgi:hypothetical protein